MWARVGAPLAGFLIASTPAMASKPTEMFRGVTQVLIDCRFDDSVPAAARASLCRQIRGQADRLSAHQVNLASPADLGGRAAELAPQHYKLILHVDARLAGGQGSGSALEVSILPERLGMRSWRGPWSNPAAVELDWKAGAASLAGQVPGLAMLLSRPEGTVPLAPRSDRY